MSLLSVRKKTEIKRVAKILGLLHLANQIEYWWGNRITSDRLRFYRRFISKGSLCFDIGAHFGLKTKLFRRLGARVVCVEPITECCQTLRALYADDPETTIIESACGEQRGTAILRYCSLNPQNSPMSDSSHLPEADSDDRQVSVTTLDALIEIHGVPRFCKIDCEGYEKEVLSGLSSSVSAISFEFHSSDLAAVESCTRRLIQLGNYRFNFTRGSVHRFVVPSWLTRAKLLLELATEPPDTAGDIFAVNDRQP